MASSGVAPTSAWSMQRLRDSHIAVAIHPTQSNSSSSREMSREESFEYYHSVPAGEMFDIKEATIALPSEARLFDSYVCERCGESTGANWIRIQNGKTLCLDCCGTYDRFHV